MRMKQTIRYSVVVPVYNEEDVIVETYRRLSALMSRTGEAFELIFVNDGSQDGTEALIDDICRCDGRVKLINFSRNFGHQIAITAGMDYAGGDAVVIIDADLQDPPEVILQMIEKWKEGYDVVYGKRKRRIGETRFKRATAKLFYRLLRLLTTVDVPVDAGDFRLIDRKVCAVLNGLKEKNRYVRGLVSWVGFRQTAVEYVREERFAGKTKYPLRKMTAFALDAITSFSYKPLKIAIYLGFTRSLLGFGYLLIVLYQRLFTDTTIAGWSSIVAMNLFFHGMVLAIIGIMGEYVGRIYDESKNRPLYIVKDVRNGGDADERW